MTDTILVTGASGNLGRRVLHHLIETYEVAPSRLIATTRTPAGLAPLSARGVSVRAADFNDPPSLDAAFAGAGTVLIVSTDELDLVGGKRRTQQEAAVAAAARAGAHHVAYTSMLKPEPGSPILFASDHYGTEQAVKASGVAYTIFQNNAYHENLLMSLPSVVATGRWYTSAGNGRVAYAARDDMAAAIAGYLAAGPRTSATIPLTGPRAYSTAEVAALVRDVTGRPTEVVPVSDEVLVDGLQMAGVPEPFARLLGSVEANVRAGNSELTSDVLETLARRAPQPPPAFLRAHKAALRQ